MNETPTETDNDPRNRISRWKHFLTSLHEDLTIHQWMNIKQKPNEQWDSFNPYEKDEETFWFIQQNVSGILFSKESLNFRLAFYKVGKFMPMHFPLQKQTLNGTCPT